MMGDWEAVDLFCLGMHQLYTSTSSCTAACSLRSCRTGSHAALPMRYDLSTSRPGHLATAAKNAWFAL